MYSSFVFVQFSGTSVAHTQPVYQQSINKYYNSLKAKDATWYKVTDAKASSIKLNKSFQPESIVPVGFTFTALQLCPECGVVVCVPRDYLLISLVLSQALRGPPVVG